MNLQYLPLDKALFKRNGLPIIQSDSDACYDLRSPKAVTIPMGSSVTIPLGFKLWIRDPSLCAEIYARSGLGINERITLTNDVGIIDAGYQGEWNVALVNNSDEDFEILKNERIAQFKLVKVERREIELVESFVFETDRGTGGFGSTGSTS